MKVFISGSGARGSNDLFFANSFKKADLDVSFFDDESLYQERLARIPFSLLKKIVNKFFWRLIARFLQPLYVSAIAQEKPDLIFIIKGLFFSPHTIAAIRHIVPNAKIFCFNPDNPFNTWHHFNSNSWIRRSIALYDVYFIWGTFLEKLLADAGARRVVYLPFAFDPSSKHPVIVSEEEKSFFGSDVAFIGSWDGEREDILSEILGYDLKVWGNAWQKAGSNVKEKWQGRDVVGDDFCKVCASSKIILNIVRRQNIPSHNMRTFEVPACGGFLLGTFTTEQSELFPEGKSGAYFHSLEDLKKKIDYYLAHEEERVAIVREAERAVAPHTFDERISAILRQYKSLV